jgi:hypothetical protein
MTHFVAAAAVDPTCWSVPASFAVHSETVEADCATAGSARISRMILDDRVELSEEHGILACRYQLGKVMFLSNARRLSV